MKSDVDLKGLSAVQLADVLVEELEAAVSNRHVSSTKPVVIDLLGRWLKLNKDDTDIVKNMEDLAKSYEKLTTVMAPNVIRDIRAVLNPPCLHDVASVTIQEVGDKLRLVCGECGKRLKITETEWV